MKKLVWLFVFAIFSHSAIAATELSRIAVIVNDDIITTLELQKQMDLIAKQLHAQNTPLPPMSVLRKQVLEREIIKQLQLQMAKGTGIIVDDNTLNNTINSIAQQNNLSLRQLRDVLEKDGFDFGEYRENIRDEMIIARLQQREVHNRANVTEQEIDNFLNTQAIQGNIDDEYLLSHILISVPEAASAAQIKRAKDKAAEVLKKLRGGADFAQMSVSYSDSQQALEGGSLGWRKAGQLPTLFADNIINLRVGEVADLIRSPSGFHIIKLMDKRSGKQHMVTQTKARHILIRPNEMLSNMAAEERLKQLKDRVENGESFEELARSHSDDPGSASQGGDLGWVNPGVMVPEFEDMMNKTEVGKISKPFQSQFGWHIIQVEGRRTQDNSEEFARNQAREILRKRKIEEMLETWVRQQRDQAYVEYKIEL